MADPDVTDCHIRDLACRAKIQLARSLVFGSQQDGKAHLRKSTPRVLHDIAIEQDPLRVLQLEQILDDKWIPVRPAHVTGLPLHPDQWLEHVVAANLDVGW